MRLLFLLAVFAATATAFAPTSPLARPRASGGARRGAAVAPRRSSGRAFSLAGGGDGDGDPLVVSSDKIWRARRAVTRASFQQLRVWQSEWAADEAADAAAADGDDAAAPADSARTAFVSTFVVLAVFAIVLRVGGRAAILSLLGLDFVQDLEV